MIRTVSDAVEERTGSAAFLHKALRYVFPVHWSFLLGEIALYSFVTLVGTGVYLALFYSPSTADTTYHGSYAPLVGQEMTKAYASGLSLSFDIPGGLLMRQTHHWAALVFVAAIVIHLMRIFFTGAFRKPRDLNYYIGLTMLMIAVFEGYLGYSLLDDLLSGMGLAIGYGVALSVPVIGASFATLVWGGQFPGSEAFFSRMFITHVLILPVALAALITVHLILVARPHHTQFAGGRETERNVVGTPMWPGYALRSIGLFLAVAGDAMDPGSITLSPLASVPSLPAEKVISMSGWVSMNTPATPTATAARASTGTNSRSPPEAVPCPPGCCTECVASKITGAPVSRARIGSARMSDTSVL